MASVSVYDAIKNFLATTFNGVYQVLDFDEIDPVLEQGQEAFIALEETPGTEELIGFGDETNLCTREDGVLILHCFTPGPEASAAARTFADQVRDSLRYQVLSGVRILDVDPPDLVGLNNGLWASATSSVNFEFNFHSARP